MWYRESIFYHIYPFGFFDTEKTNNFGENKPVLKNFMADSGEKWLNHLEELNINAVYFGPVFESSSHGYDTSDFSRIDSRLGTNEDFKNLCLKLKSRNIKIVLDGVFNHVGRDFWAFRDVCEKKQNSHYCDWFFLSFDGNSRYDDGFWYEGWEGHFELVKLNLTNSAVKNHIFETIKGWIKEFDIDGLRLDVAYSLDHVFLSEVNSLCKFLKNDFVLIGELLHGDYRIWVNSSMLDSCTNYECYKGIYSAINSKNMFEIAHSLNNRFCEEPWAMYKDLTLYNFLDNHDVTRIASSLTNSLNLKNAYTILFGMPGVPSVYYGSEWGIGGEKSKGDNDLRPFIDIEKISSSKHHNLNNHIKALSKARNNSVALKYGKYKQLHISSEQLAFMRFTEDKQVYVFVNISATPFTFKLKEQVTLKDLISGEIVTTDEVTVSSYFGTIMEVCS